MRTRRQHGFALLMVMIVVAVGCILGLSYLSVASLKMNVSANFQAMSRARYLAESGLEHGLYVLRTAPHQFDGSGESPLGPYFVDGSADEYRMGAVPCGETPGKYLLTATGKVGGVSWTCSATVFRHEGRQFEVGHGLLVGSGFTWLPWCLQVNGDVHINGFLLNNANIDGDVTTTDGLWDPWGRISGDTEDAADSVDVPGISFSQYQQYDLGWTAFEAATFEGTDFVHTDPLSNGGAVTDENPAGVVHLQPESGNSVTLHDGVNFTGTLVIDGDIVLDGRNITLTAVASFPAIVASGQIIITDDARNVTVNGLVAAKLGIIPAGPGTWNSSTTINGAVISDVRGYSVLLFGEHTLNFDRSRAQAYDMSVAPELRRPTVEILSWED